MTVRWFDRFSNKGIDDPGGDNARWFCDLHLRSEVEDSLTRSQPVGDWDPNTRFTPKVKGPIEDYPWCMRSVPVVSDRLRRLIETHAPNNAQFLPVRILYAGQPFDAGQPYWVANWLNIADGRKVQKQVDNSDMGHYFDNLILFDCADPAVHIFRWRDNPTVEFMSQDLRQILTSAGVTGIQYY
ncbi:MAG TPA: DUF1629 domain-containing protein [Phycisphaerales bacterium]|nr:DUF1629 domain-containing protein [Phycisphaerales bacterium]